MRVVLICPYSVSIPGGVQNQVLGLARSLRKRGHTTYVLAPCDGPPPDANVVPVGSSVPTAANGSVAPLAPDFSAALRTVRVLRDERFDVMHLHEPLCPGPTLTALLFSDTPSVGTFHRKGVMSRHSLVKPMAKSWAQRLEVRVAVSEESRKTAETMYGGNYETLFNGVELHRFQDAEDLRTIRPTIFFLGRHEHRKGLGIFIESLQHLPDEIQVWIAGIGPDTDELMNQSRGDKRVQWLGRISDTEAASRMKSADVYCAPSLLGESFGVVLLEAMASGTAVVASDIPGYRSVAEHEKNALLVPPGDTQALAEALSRVLSNSSLSAQLVAAGVEHATQFDMDILAERYEAIYERARLIAR